MSNFSDFSESGIIQHFFGANTFAKPAVIAIALASGVPLDAHTGGVNYELGNVGGYARQTLNPSNANWSHDSLVTNTTANLSAITFPQATADWGIISGVMITSSASYGVGNVYFWGQLASSKTVLNTDQLIIPISGLTITIQ